MICPYLTKSELTRQREDDITTTATQYYQAECKREHCGAWYKGHCDYNGFARLGEGITLKLS